MGSHKSHPQGQPGGKGQSHHKGQVLWVPLEQGEPPRCPWGWYPMAGTEMPTSATDAFRHSGTSLVKPSVPVPSDTPIPRHGHLHCGQGWMRPRCVAQQAANLSATVVGQGGPWVPAGTGGGSGEGDGEGAPSPATPTWGWGVRFPALFLLFPLLSRPSSVSDASGNLVIQEIAIRPLTQDMLQHEVCHPWDAQEGCPFLLAA